MLRRVRTPGAALRAPGSTSTPLLAPGDARATVQEQTLQSMATPRFALDFLTAAFISIFSLLGNGIPTFRVQLLHGGAFFATVALPRLAAAISYRGGIPTVRAQPLRGCIFLYGGGIPTVRGQVLHVGTFNTAVASPWFAVKFFMAARFSLRWHPRGSRSTSSWLHCLVYRGGIPTVRGQVLHAGTFITAVAPRFTDGASSCPLLLMLVVVCVLMVWTGTFSLWAGGDVLC